MFTLYRLYTWYVWLFWLYYRERVLRKRTSGSSQRARFPRRQVLRVWYQLQAVLNSKPLTTRQTESASGFQPLYLAGQIADKGNQARWGIIRGRGAHAECQLVQKQSGQHRLVEVMSVMLISCVTGCCAHRQVVDWRVGDRCCQSAYLYLCTYIPI